MRFDEKVSLNTQISSKGLKVDHFSILTPTVFRSKSRNWLGVKCSAKRAFLCESNFIYPEVDIERYNVTVDIDAEGRVEIALKVKFDPVLNGDARDVPFTLVVPKNAGKIQIPIK